MDPDNANGGTASQVFDSIRFIPLETTKESLFGSIDQLEVTDSLFIILDVRGRSILLFNRNGKFFAKMTTGGIGKYFYSFTLDRASKEIIVINNYANGLMVYDFQGKLLRKEPCPDEVESLYHFSDKTVLYDLRRLAHSEPADDIRYDLAYSRGYNTITKYVKPYNARYETGEFNGDCNFFNFSGEAGSCMFSMPFEYTIYQLNDTGIIHKYQFIFPLSHSLPLNFATDGVYRDKRAKFAYSTPGNESTITALERGYKLGDYLLFTIVSQQPTVNADRNYLYNLKSSNFISFSRVTGDSTSSYFPILPGVLEQINAIDDNTIFSSMAAFRFFVIRNDVNKKVAYPESLQQFFSTGKKTDNPVIIQFRLKPNL